MKIRGWFIDGFGIFRDYEVRGLSGGLTVLYGPNEAGKTTLLQFMRSVLYGFSPERRRYLPPVHGGKPGGSLWVTGPGGECVITRHQSLDAARGEELLVFTPDGARHAEPLLKTLLCNVDESVFNNVFAVGLRELQELAEAGNMVGGLRTGHADSYPRSLKKRPGNTACGNQQAVGEEIVYIDPNIIVIERKVSWP